jgi:hypothetical protein
LQVDDLAGEERLQDFRSAVGGVALVGGEEARQTRFLQRHGPRFAEMIGSARSRVFPQQQARPVERAGQHPRRLHARAFGAFDLDAAPLLPERGSREGRDQSDREHRREQGGAAACTSG